MLAAIWEIAWHSERPLLSICLLVAMAATTNVVAPTRAAEVGHDKTTRQIQFDEDLVLADGSDDQPVIGSATSVAVDSRGNIYIADPGALCLWKFAEDGTFLSALGREGDGPGDIMGSVALAIDDRDRIYIAGQGGRVDQLDTDGVYLGGFERGHPSTPARSISTGRDGNIVMAAPDLIEQTVLDLYTGEHVFVKSFGETFAANSDVDWRIESLYAGGYVTTTKTGEIYFVQLAPFAIKKYSASGELLLSTTKGGEDFVPSPPEPDTKDGRFRVFFSWAATGMVVLSDGRVLCSTFRRAEDMTTLTSELYLYDSNLELLATRHEDRLCKIVGADRNDRVFFFVNDEPAPRVIRGHTIRIE